MKTLLNFDITYYQVSRYRYNLPGLMGTLVYLICIAVASFAVLAQPAVTQGGVNATLPLTYPGEVLQGDGSQTCPSEAQRGRVRNEVDNATLSLLRESVVPLLQTFSCDGSTGWRRVAYLDMSNPSHHCPSVWLEYTTPHRVCGRRSTGDGSCEGLNYTTGSEQYDQVCGRIIGYTIGYPEAFISGPGRSIDTYYVDGVSVTHGFPRKHIWTFANGLDEQRTIPISTCPCVNGSAGGSRIPWFVDQNYFCETGRTRWTDDHHSGVFFPDSDPLWDGQGCGPTSSCCTFHSPPWFNVTLPSPTTDYIEVRICMRSGIDFEDTPIQLIELYVK